MSDSTEVVLAELPVTAKLAIGYERLRVFVTDRRLLFAYIGKRGTGDMMGTNIMGRLATGLEAVLKSGPEHQRRKRAEKAEQKEPDRILKSHKDNFAISYDEIVSLTLDEFPPLTRMTLLTRNEKLELSSSTGVDRLNSLLLPRLGEKLQTDTYH